MSKKLLSVIIIFMFPVPALANMGIPLLFYMIQWQVLFLLVVIAIEAFVIKKYLELSYLKACAATAYANILSTLLGAIVAIALSFSIMLPLPLWTWGTGATIALIVFLYPFYRVSVWFEYYALEPHIAHPDLKTAVISGNRISYFMLFVFLVANIIKSFYVNGRIVW